MLVEAGIGRASEILARVYRLVMVSYATKKRNHIIYDTI